MKTAFIFSVFGALAIVISASSIAEDSEDPRNLFYDYASVKPTIYTSEKGKRDVHSTTVHAGDELVLEFQAFGKNFEVNLHMNKDLLSDKYFEEHEEDGEIKIVYPMKEVDAKHCHYQGYLKGASGSWAALSICHGISGVIFDGQELFYVEPDHITSGEKHFVFRASDMVPQNVRCGVSDDEIHSEDPLSEKHFQEPLNSVLSKEISKTQYVELVYVVDKAEYGKLQTTANVYQKCKTIANIVNSLYTSLNVSVSLVGVKIWRDRDEIRLGNSIRDALRNFADYRRDTLTKEYSFDVAQMFSGQTFQPTINGIAFKAIMVTMCDSKYSCGVIKDYSPINGMVGATSAHEMGHNFGMQHDFELKNCHCPVPDCIMDYSNRVRTAWSSCSIDAIDRNVNSGRFTCLSNVPTKTLK